MKSFACVTKDRPPAAERRRRPTPPRFADLPDLCTPDEARAFLRVGKNTMYELLKSGAIPCERFGKQLRIPKQALLSGTKTS